MIESNNKHLILMVGPPGAGKSTTAVALAMDLGLTYINQDAQGKDHLRLFNEAIERGDNIIVDRLNFDKRQRSRYLEPAKKAGYTTEIVVHHVPKAVCMERCLKRLDHATIKNEKDASSALNMFFSKYERVTDDEADSVIRLGHEGVKEKAILIDLDNTLSNATHREHYLNSDKKNWKSFFAEMVNDPVNTWCKDLMVGMINSVCVIISSGRPDNYRKETQEWLAKHNIPYNHLFMRPRNDSRKDSIIKEIIYDFEISPYYDLIFCVDDRKQVIDQMRSRGLLVLDCAGEKGNF